MSILQIISTFFALLLVVAIIYQFGIFFIRIAFKSFLETTEQIRVRFRMNNSISLKRKHEPYLDRYFPYYSTLSEESRIKFLLRVESFIDRKIIEGRDEFRVTDEVETLIAASAVQLTFGLEYYWIDHFHTFLIYPDVFHNKHYDRFHRGETNPRGIVVLSWKHFLEGYKNSTDKINLGLHEMAHALDLSRRAGDTDDYFKSYYNKWFKVSKTEYDNMQNQPSFLREYAGENFREFFAVCIEHFFEAPKEFKTELPLVYLHLSRLLKQDPSLKQSDFDDTNIVTPNKILRHELLLKPIYSGTKNTNSIYQSIMSMLPVVIVISIIILSFSLSSFIFPLVAFVIGVPYIYKSRKVFEIYKEHVVVRSSIFKNHYNSFSFDNVISINFDLNGDGLIQIVCNEKGRIETFHSILQNQNLDETRIRELLDDQGILISGL